MTMQYRTPARLGRPLSVIGQGCWQLGSDWGEVSETDATAVHDTSLDAGITFFDTADVYGDGRSERLVGSFRAASTVRTTEPASAGRAEEQAGSATREASTGHPLFVATKASRRAEPFVPETFTEENIRAWIERSRTNLGMDTLDLVQLHCPPPAIYEDDRVFELLDTLVEEGKLAAWGVSVETCAEALRALDREHLASIQIILNPFRLKPLDEVVPQAEAKGVAIIARVPLASGLLSGRYDAQTTFAADDHRTYNRAGEAFDRGETFSGVDFDRGLQAVARLKEALDGRMPLAEASLRWIVDQPGVTAAIPGARRPEQVRGNAAAGSQLTGDERMVLDAFGDAVRDTYDELLRERIHPQW